MCQAVANEFEDGGKAPWAESWCELQENEAEGVTKVAGPTCAVVDEVGNLTAEGEADDEPTGRPAEGTARTRRNGTAAHAQGEGVEGGRKVNEYVFRPGLGRLWRRAVVPGMESDVRVEAVHVLINAADSREGGGGE